VDEVGKVLPIVFKKQVERVDPRLAEILASLWARVAGQGIAQRSRPVAFAAGTLTLAAADSSWAGALAAMTDDLRSKINAFLGRPVVKAIRIREALNLAWPTPAGGTNRKLPGPIEPTRIDWTDAVEKLDPEIARIVRLSYAKYFARSGKGVA
jgi:hypothetical protein